MVITCKQPCKKKKSTMLTVEQMVDIALGTPEIGAVNFNVLHALIHVMVQQLNIQKCLVEFKGYDSDRMEGIILSAKPGPILKLSEYMIDTGDGKPCPSREKTSKKEEGEADEKEPPVKKVPCECMGKKRKSEEEKEKSEKGKGESEGEEKKPQEKKIKKELTAEECEEISEPEPKKVKEVKKTKPCPCKGSKEPEVPADESLKAVPSSYYGSDSEGACQTIVRVEQVGERCDSWRSRPALAHESMVRLEEKVAMLQDAFEALEQMPTNEELKKRAQGAAPSTPVKDLWQIYNLNKRVEGCEGTIEKLASMIEDLVKETCNFREAMLVIADAVDEIECADQTARNTCCAALQARMGSGPGVGAATFTPSKGTSSQRPGTEGQTVTFAQGCGGQPCEEKITDQSQPQSQAQAQAQAQAQVQSQSQTQVQMSIAKSAKTTLSTQPQSSSKQAEAEKPPTEEANDNPTTQPAEAPAMKPEDEQREQQTPLPDASPFNADIDPRAMGTVPMGLGPEFNKMSAAEKFCVLKQNVECLMCQVKTINDNIPVNQIASKLCALVSMQKQLDALEKEWRAFLASFGNEGVSGMINSLKNMRGDIDNLNNLISNLIAEKQEMDAMIRNILQEIESLKKVKADLELVEDLLAEKADAAVVNRKVSHDQFDAACDDLTRGLDEALERLMQQEAMWNEAMEELHKDMDNKLDKNEIMPLKEFITKKLKCLQEKLKQLAQLRKDAEAAGAKSRILRNLNCIACDNDVIMKMDNTSSYQRSPLPPSRSIKPMLTYELDQVRKAMKKGPPCRAAGHVEEAIADAKQKAIGIPLTAREAVDSKMAKLAHFCNRYCGGSHTITTPQQRVTRIGHFLTEFGPQALALFNQENCLDSKSTQGLLPSGAVTPDAELRKPC